MFFSDRVCISADRKHAMTMTFHETVMALLSFISTYFPFPYISVTFTYKCFEWIAVFVSSKNLKFHDGLRVLATLFLRCHFRLTLHWSSQHSFKNPTLYTLNTLTEIVVRKLYLLQSTFYHISTGKRAL